jgi:hypothetical protein
MMMRWFAGRFNKREHGSWALGLLTVFPSSERAARTEQAGWLQRERERGFPLWSIQACLFHVVAAWEQKVIRICVNYTAPARMAADVIVTSLFLEKLRRQS